MELQIPESWQPLRDELVGSPATVMIVGAQHVGKSTLTRWLANELVGAGRRVALVDADLGQSNVGPPGTLGMASLRKRFDDYHELTPYALFFIGALSPVGVEAACVAGMSKLLKLARRQGPQTILVNTAGYLDVPHLLNLIGAVEPTVLVLLSHQGELEELQATLPDAPGRRVVALAAAEAAVRKTDSERQANRSNAFEQYFQTAQTWAILPVQVRVQSTKGTDAPWLPGMLVGLLDGAGVCHGVGVSLPLSREGSFRVLSPLHTVNNIQKILMGTYQVPQEQVRQWLARPQSPVG